LTFVIKLKGGHKNALRKKKKKTEDQNAQAKKETEKRSAQEEIGP